VTVALSGDGGDETFGGYRRYRMHLMEERLRSLLPHGVRRPLFGLLGRVYPKADWAPRMFRAKTTFKAWGEARWKPISIPSRSCVARCAVNSSAIVSEVKSTATAPRRSLNSHARRAGTDDPLALIQYLDLKTYLVGDINTKVDRASMAHSLEVREPLMDHELVEWMATLPSSLKVRGQEGKFLLKER
jgi:asparagine synthase (glutamine-hydrolysing)